MDKNHLRRVARRVCALAPLRAGRIAVISGAAVVAMACASTSTDRTAPDNKAPVSSASKADTPSSSLASPTPSATPVHPPMPDAKIIVTELEGLTVHTVMGPEEVLAVTSHVLETRAHLVVVDTQLTTQHSAQLRALCERLDKPIAHLIVSHGHPDHYFGLTAFEDVAASAFPEVRRYIGKRYRGHQAMHKTMEGPLIPDVIVQPTIDLEPADLVVDDVVIKVERVRGGEDVLQALIWLPGQDAVIAQDLVSNGYHAFFGTGPLKEWVSTLDRIALTSPQVVFAGHGPPGDATLLPATREYVQKAFAWAASARSKAELITTVMEAFPERKGRFLVEVSALIVFRDRSRAAQQKKMPMKRAP